MTAGTLRPSGGAEAADGASAPRPAASLARIPIRRPASRRTQAHGQGAAPSTPSPAGTRAAPTAIIDYWEQLAGARIRPAIAALVHATIARQWPNSLLLRVVADGRRSALEVAHMFAPAPADQRTAIPIDAMSVDWIMELGREAVESGNPIHETDAMPTQSGAIECGVIVLPFGNDGAVDHVLCHLYRGGAPAAAPTGPAGTGEPPASRIRRLFGG